MSDTRHVTPSHPPHQPSEHFLLEEAVLDYWKTNKIFEKSIEIRPEDSQWTFLDGPPFITGLPHYGHIIGSILKDVFPRFKTMQGYRVRRVWGWDGHGLPIENKVETALGIRSKREITEKIGVKKFIQECHKYVQDVSGEWEWYIEHIGRWVNFSDAYRTWDRDYMESVMWVFKQMYEKGYIYKGLRVSLFCPHCSTPISNFEVAMDAGENYKRVKEPANIYKYRLVSRVFTHNLDDPTYFLAWSTTPWTKLTTTALAVNPDLTYVVVEHKNERYILAESTLQSTFAKIGVDSSTLVITHEFVGRDMVGWKFEGHYDFYPPAQDKKRNLVVADGFVTADEGTGIVTIAPYGEEDLEVMQREDIQIVQNVDDEGKLTSDNPNGWGGMYYLKVNPLVNEDLARRGLMFHEDPAHEHTVAHCWRCGTRLFYNPHQAWYVNVQRLKTKIIETNENVSWYPEHFKHGRYENSVKAAPDWCISRSRFWGSPVPVWECTHADGEVERFVPGSISELEERAGVCVKDLHKPEIDEIVVRSLKDPTIIMRRTPEVLDSWIEAGSASFAERHFPFDTTQKRESFFPPDFITEYTGQIRAWFYVLHVISAALYDSHAFKHVLVSGVILGTDGRKMSKNYKNYPDPRKAIEQYGADALRLYLLGSPVTKAEDINMSEHDWRDQLRTFIIPLHNIFAFFEMYAQVDGYVLENQSSDFKMQDATHVLDKWLVSVLHATIDEVTTALESYDTVRAVSSITQLTNDWSKWHVRRSRDRVGEGSLTPGAWSFYATTQYVLSRFLELIAPIVPFRSEYFYRKLYPRVTSVHLQSYPRYDRAMRNQEIEQAMSVARMVCERGHEYRKKHSLKVRTPLRSLLLEIPGINVEAIPGEIWDLVLDELNVKCVVVNGLSYPSKPINITDEQLQFEGEVRELIRTIQAKRKELKLHVKDPVRLTIPRQYISIQSHIARKTNAREVIVGDTLRVEL
jgi:isoleucyl-tRNA synthetase